MKGLQWILKSSKTDRLEGCVVKLFQYDFPELEKCAWKNEGILNEIISVLEIEPNDIFSASELEWIARMSYNAAVKLHNSAQLEPLIRLLDLSISFSGRIHNQPDPNDPSNVSQHHLLCNFLKITRTTADARRETNPTEKEKLYTESYKTITNFQNQNQSPLATTEPTLLQEPYLSKHRIILSLHLEASIHLNDWPKASQIIESTSPIIDDKLSSVFLDCILRAESPSSDIVRAVKTLLRTLHASPSPHLNHQTISQTLPRYIRCLFQLSLSAADDPLAESVLDQAIVLVRDPGGRGGGYQGPDPSSSSSSLYPSDEVRWLATVAFNRAVDFYLVARDEDCRRWAGKAIVLADGVDGVGGDGGELGELLRERLEMLVAS
ncbi:hypothetical protein BO70DRAFT_389529 [Aspergillus heteromorphus CBS 117.55]|uniref:Protein ZIP4 homolog n=1 Tax=Aspergillus heteromorphus CBS 117.55 TaxID=1448321 RepID=A0A317VFK9_9EURO|nr:uncharacterized protein BO70DRAFT_389529 [Aspergillus heteromorphus CBS 117.55]PWY71662.1 hypothetical protein BO70DRAFT_389529 [Aspergillus heteromorphus CBS 117.55]